MLPTENFEKNESCKCILVAFLGDYICRQYYLNVDFFQKLRSPAPPRPPLKTCHSFSTDVHCQISKSDLRISKFAEKRLF